LTVFDLTKVCKTLGWFEFCIGRVLACISLNDIAVVVLIKLTHNDESIGEEILLKCEPCSLLCANGIVSL
jgi:hypothetical protein